MQRMTLQDSLDDVDLDVESEDQTAMDDYDDLEEFEFLGAGRRPRRMKDNHKKKKTKWEIHALLEERPRVTENAVQFFAPSLSVTSAERAWLEENLGPFRDTRVITSVLRKVKGGKEANVYCCAAHPATGLGPLAAKVYRPRLFRSLRNDTQYRQGRALLGADGKPADIKRREARALELHSRFGRELEHTSWLAYEFYTLERLYDAGVSVPQPFKQSEHVILMDYVGDVGLPAPALSQVHLASAETQPLFAQLLGDVETMLAHGVIHGDFSAYNVLYWEGEVKIIDFPQVVNPDANRDARFIFGRDVERLCQYFAKYGVRANPRKIAHALWEKYVAARVRAHADFVDEALMEAD